MKYTVQNTILLHNGKKYPEGDVIELTKKEAEKLSDFLAPYKEENTQESQGDKKDKSSKDKKGQENPLNNEDRGDNNNQTEKTTSQTNGGKP